MMPDDNTTDFGTFYAGLSALAGAGRYQEALDRATAAQPRYPEDHAILVHFRAGMLARLGDAQGALALLEEALNAGEWYTQVFWEAPDLASLRDLDEFHRLRALSDQRQVAAQTRARPELFVRLPEKAMEPLPVLLALHGNMHNATIEFPRWSGLLARGWLVALAQSSQIARPKRYVWTDHRKAERELKAHYEALRDEYPIEAGHFVAGGFSMGAELALTLALRGVLPADGFIAVAPAGPLLREPDEIDRLLDEPLPSGLRGVMVIGTDDPMLDLITALADRLQAAGLPLHLWVVDGLGHDYPPDFADRLPELIAFLVEG